MWAPAKLSADSERKALEECVAERGELLEGGIQAWDWRYYAEKVQRAVLSILKQLVWLGVFSLRTARM